MSSAILNKDIPMEFFKDDQSSMDNRYIQSQIFW